MTTFPSLYPTKSLAAATDVHPDNFKKNFRYSLYFTSLISPNFDPKSSSFTNLIDDSLHLPRRLQLKKSYLLLSWFLYLTDVGRTPNDPADSSTPANRPHARLAILPASRKLYTLTKAPMAHKTNSKEQFMFRFYAFKFSVSVTTPVASLPSTVNQSLAVHFLVRRLFPFFETNMMFIKYYSVHAAFYDPMYYSLYALVNGVRSPLN